MEQSKGGGSCPRSSLIVTPEKETAVNVGTYADFGRTNGTSAPCMMSDELFNHQDACSSEVSPMLVRSSPLWETEKTSACT
jgi:hypothetical protein